MTRKGHEEAEWAFINGIAKVLLWLVLLFWPLAAFQHDGRIRWWAWLIEVPWFLIVVITYGSWKNRDVVVPARKKPLARLPDDNGSTEQEEPRTPAGPQPDKPDG